MNTDLISPSTRRTFREYMVGNWVLREIHEAFDEAGVTHDAEYQPPSSISGERRTLVEQYYHAVSWKNSRDVKKILCVFENVLAFASNRKTQLGYTTSFEKAAQKDIECMVNYLKRDGFDFIDGKIIKGINIPLLDDIKELATQFDAKHLAEQIHRMAEAIDTDSSLAIGTAKELIETCCKTILEERGKSIAGTPDVSQLTKETIKELKLLPVTFPKKQRVAKLLNAFLTI
ncbi:MAG: hypothetical protein V1746_02710 [bacterium]